MGLAREIIRAITVAAAAGVAAGGALGLLAPSFATAGPAARPAPPPAQAPRPVVVTGLDLLAGDRLEVTLRFTNTGPAVRHLDPAAITVTADGAALPALPSARAAVVDLRPGATAEETVAFAAPPAGASLTLTLPGGERLPLET
ncbi:hypothetical protein ABT297_15485 [Dactylosporangium sp. NPDC000555]|uniref:hypothetical protein n=1 Tax=Dactylosporangium sp. NPDC000555 TaxID=3154260 RepID=UPI00331E73BE